MPHESYPVSEVDALVANRSVLPARAPFVEVDADDMVRLAEGVSTLELLDRDERLLTEQVDDLVTRADVAEDAEEGRQ